MPAIGNNAKFAEDFAIFSLPKVKGAIAPVHFWGVIHERQQFSQTLGPVQVNGTSATGNTATAKPIGQIFGMPAWPQGRGMAYYPWDGKLDSGLYAPAGHYRFVVRALRIFGDVSNPEDWDVATTQSMILEYKQ
ncbi:hypothetical protein E4U60_005491 [Claviceps pazoutovae]|uniref:Uncharacterized protein n=1 Tax=Claviceps pazoutovae TaxID=1649127 RepID=A0A9P7M7R9_9HYPO|nr:hypothetical protein E4U60_005491 [Claviceps pazoutovae]